MLTNTLATYRLPDYLALARLYPNLTIFLSKKSLGENLAGSAVDAGARSGLDIRYVRSLSFVQRHRHSQGFTQDATILIPYDIVPKLRALRPDVIVSTELGARSLQASLFRRFSRRAKLVIHADLSERTELGRGWIRRQIRRFILSQADAILVNGEGGRRYVSRYGIPAKHIFTVPYSTVPDSFLRIARDTDPGAVLRLLYVGQFIPRKGLVPFLRLLASWCEAHPERAVRWMLVGQGETEAELKAFQLPLNLELCVRPAVSYNELPSIYRQGDIFVLPTLADTWALVVNEAMLSGLPVLGSVHSQAVAELVLDGRNGWLFDPEQDCTVFDALDRALLLEPEAISSLGGVARERAKALTPEVVAQAIQAAIEFVAGSSARSALPDRRAAADPSDG